MVDEVKICILRKMYNQSRDVRNALFPIRSRSGRDLYVIFYLLSAIRFSDRIAVYCNHLKVVFANKSGKLGWIWMKLGRWG